MTRDDILFLAAEYAALLRDRGLEPEHLPDIYQRINCENIDDRTMLLRHALWACLHIPEQIDGMGGHELCMRWIGTIQGTLTAYGLLTIAQARKRFREFAPPEQHHA